MTQHSAATKPLPSPAQRPGPGDLTRVTVNLTRNACEAMSWLVAHTGDTKTDTINRALSVYRFIEETSRNGGGVFVREPGQGELQRLKLF